MLPEGRSCIIEAIKQTSKACILFLCPAARSIAQSTTAAPGQLATAAGRQVGLAEGLSLTLSVNGADGRATL